MGDTNQVSLQALGRMPNYLQTLRQLQANGAKIVSATMVANLLSLNEVQVRKDFSSVSSRQGRPRTGFPVEELIRDIECLLDYNHQKLAVLAGVGSLGRALITYDKFRDYGLSISAGFDVDADIIGTEIAGKPILDIRDMASYAEQYGIQIGIITCPASAAQSVADMMAQAGILAIWNFAPAHLRVPEGIAVQSENMAASLAVLTQRLLEKQSEAP